MAKILHICGLDSFVSSIRPLLESLMENGHEVHCACTDTGLFAALNETGIRMVRTPVIRKLTAPSNLNTVKKLYRLIRKEKYDIVHVHNPIASMLGRVAAKLAGCKTIIYTSHGFYFHEHMKPMKYRFFYQIEKWLTRLCVDRLFLVSREDYELCLNTKFKKREALFHVSNGVELAAKYNPDSVSIETIARMKSELGIAENDKIVVYVGRLVREKGILELIEAFHALKTNHPNAKLMLVGENHNSERDRTLLGMLPDLYHEDVLFLGFRTDIPALLALSDIFVLPSHREGMPLSILEAMAMAKPVVATDIRGCREEVRHGQSGFLVPVKDSTALSNRLDELLQEDSLRESFGLEGRKLAIEHYDIRDIVERQLDIYSDIIPHAHHEPRAKSSFKYPFSHSK